MFHEIVIGCHGMGPRPHPSSLDCGLAEVSVGLASEVSMVAITFRSEKIRRSRGSGGESGGDVTQKSGDFLTKNLGELL